MYQYQSLIIKVLVLYYLGGIIPPYCCFLLNVAISVCFVFTGTLEFYFQVKKIIGTIRGIE